MKLSDIDFSAIWGSTWAFTACSSSRDTTSYSARYRAVCTGSSALCRSCHQNRYGVDLEADEIFLLKGSQEALTHVPLVYCDPGDTVLIPDPYYPIYGTAFLHSLTQGFLHSIHGRDIG